MSNYSSSYLSKSQPNLYSSNLKNSLEKKAWFIGKFLCRNLDRLTYLKVTTYTYIFQINFVSIESNIKYQLILYL